MNKQRARTSTTARATVSVEITGLGSWGPDCKLDQVYRQAQEEAEKVIRRALQGTGARIIGEPVVQAVTTNLEKGGSRGQ